MPITALPVPPSRSDAPQDFSDRADALLGALPLFVTEANALQTEVNANEQSALNAAISASNSAAQAQDSAAAATTKAGEASASAAAAAASASIAAIAFDSFDDKYLGAKSSDPTTDNDGDALIPGAIYWNTTLSANRVWNGVSWQTAINPSDSSAVAFQHAGTGAVARTAQDKLREIVSVKDFGAIGDGIADDTAAFNLAFAAASRVFVPFGTYKITSIVSATGKFVLLEGTLTGSGSITGGVFERRGSNVLAVGQNSKNSGADWQGLQLGGGNPHYGLNGVTVAPDEHSSWLRFQPSKNESNIEVVIYPTAAQGIAQAQNGTNQVVRQSGSSFTADWIGKKFYLGGKIYRVATVTDADSLIVTTDQGDAVSFASTFSETYHVSYISGAGICDVSGTTVTRVNGDPFIPFITSRFVLKINGTIRTVSSYEDESTLVLSSAPGDVTGATYTFETDINDQITTLRLQKLLGSNEENLSLFARHDGYHVRSQFAGSGSYRKIWIGTGDNAGNAYDQIVVQPNGDLTLGGDYTEDAIRILAQNGTVANRLETQAAPTGFIPGWRARGSDTNVGMRFDAQGVGTFTWTGGSFSTTLFQVFGSTTGTSWLAVGASTTDGPTLSANGAAADIDIKLAPKGSGAVWVGSWASNADAAVNGYITVKDSAGNVRKIATIA